MSVDRERRGRQNGRPRFLEEALLEETADVERSRAKRRCDRVAPCRSSQNTRPASGRIERACELARQLGPDANRVRQIAQEQLLALSGLGEIGNGHVIHLVDR